jgi:NodT family efflux transporter outer membrane factor (OMF) lipoprotein
MPIGISRLGIDRTAVALALLLSGCAAMTTVKPVATPVRVNTLQAGSDIGTAPHTDWPQADWWRGYGDPQLDALIEKAIAGSPHLASAQARVAAAQGMARSHGAALQPQVAAGANFDRTRFSQDYYLPGEINGHDLLAPVWNNSAGLTGSYNFDPFGGDRAGLEASLDQVKVAEYEAQNARLVLEASVFRVYAELGYFYEIQDHEQAIIATETQTLDLAARRLAAGLGTELEIQQAKTAVAATRAQLADIDGQMVLLRHQLAALSGAGPGAAETLQRPILSVTQTIGLPSLIPAELIGRRPDVQAERWRVESAAKQIDAAKAAFYPNLNLKAAVGLVGIGFGDFLSTKAINASLGPALTLPIFTGGKLRADLDVRTAAYDAAVDAYNAAIVTALQEVADQISQLKSIDELQQRRLESRDYAQRAHELALIAFRAGLTDYNNVLTTEDALSRAQNLLADLGLRRLSAFAALNQALGGGLVATEVEGPPTVSRR